MAAWGFKVIADNDECTPLTPPPPTFNKYSRPSTSRLLFVFAGVHGGPGIQGDDSGRIPLHAHQRAGSRFGQDGGGGGGLQAGRQGGAAFWNPLPLQALRPVPPGLPPRISLQCGLAWPQNLSYAGGLEGKVAGGGSCSARYPEKSMTENSDE